MRSLIKGHHKVGLALIGIGLLSFVTSFLLPAVSSYFIIAGIGFVLVGLFVIDPTVLP